MSKTWMLLVVCSFFSCEPRLFAQTSEPVSPELSAPAPTPVPEKKPELKWSGDLRYRLAKVKEAIDEPRPYQQLRARLQLKADINSELKAQLRLATATSAISANQTLGDSSDPGFARRSFGIDIASAIWTPLESLQVSMGRVANPYFSVGKSQLIFDSDLSFEGFSLQGDWKFESSRIYANAGSYIVSENYDSATRSDVVDVGLVGLQIGYAFDFGAVQSNFYVSTQHYLNIQDLPITSLERNAKSDVYSIPFDRYRGNSIYTLNPGDPPATRKFQMLNKYVLYNAGAEVSVKFFGADWSLYTDLVKNQEATQQNSGHEMGVSVKLGRTTIAFANIRKEADSVVATYTDSDANGGGTDNQGQRVTLGYTFSKNSMVAVNQYATKRGIGSVERDYSLTQVDFMMNF